MRLRKQPHTLHPGPLPTWGEGTLLARGLPKTEQDEALGGLMEKTIHTVQAAIARGKLS